MALIGTPDWERPVSFDAAALFASYGDGPFRLAPSRCAVMASGADDLPFQLELVRGLSADESRAVLSFTLTADYETDAALVRAREVNSDATVAAIVLTDWQFRFLPSPTLRPETGILDPVLLLSNGVGTARLRMALAIEAGLLLESVLKDGGTLPAVAEASALGVSPRVPVVVRFRSTDMLDDLRALADDAGAMPRSAIVDYFRQDVANLPLDLSGTAGAAATMAFAETMTDRVIARFGRFIAAQSMNDAPVVLLQPPSSAVSTLTWSLSTPLTVVRRLAFPVDMLSAAQRRVTSLGAASVIVRRDLASLPALGITRLTVMFNLPVARSGIAALGVTLVFPPYLPHRPQPVIVTVPLEDDGTDMVEVTVRLSPGEPLRYRFTTFAVLENEAGTRQVDSPEMDGAGHTLRLTPDLLPIAFARVEATPALIQLATLRGTCSYEAAGMMHSVPFSLDTGNLSVAIAIPREHTGMSLKALAFSRDGGDVIALDPIESTDARFDLGAFPSYGPRQTVCLMRFDDAATIRGVSFLPAGAEDRPENIVTLAFTPTAPRVTMRWFASSPFARAMRYRAHDASGGWQVAAIVEGQPIVITNSSLGGRETARIVPVRQARPVTESMPQRPRRTRTEAEPATPESAVVAIAYSPEEDVTDTLVFTRIEDESQRLYVPRYSLGVDPATNGQRYQIAIGQEGDDSTLTIGLGLSPPPGMPPEATEYPHALTVALDFLMSPPAGARRTLDFSDLTRDANHLWAKLTFASLMERDEAYRALTEPDRQARLIVRRVIDVAAPEPPARPQPDWGGSGGLGNGGGLSGQLPRRIVAKWPPPKLVAPDDFSPVVYPVTPVDLGTLGSVNTLGSSMHLATTMPNSVSTLGASTHLAAATLGGVKPLSSSSVFMAASSLSLARESTLATMVLRSRLAIDDSVRIRPRRVVDTLPVPVANVGAIEQLAAGGTSIVVGVTNWADYSDDFFVAAPDLPPGGANLWASRTWVDVEDGETGKRLYQFCDLSSAKQLSGLSFMLSPGSAAPASLRIRLLDRRSGTERVSESAASGGTRSVRLGPDYRILRVQLEQVVNPSPFAFSPALHGYIIEGSAPTGGPAPLIRHALQWKGRFYTYLQDPARRSLVYMFPDSFKIARRRDPPFTPFATVRVNSKADGSDTVVIFDYVVAPSIDAKRLSDARTQLLAQPQFGASDVAFKPLPTSDIRFFTDRPTVGGSLREQRSDARVVLQGAVKDTLIMPLADFRLLFDAMHQSTAALFLGRVEIDVPGSVTEIIPFEARFGDLEGEIFSYEAVADGDRLRVALVNAIESPVDIQTLDATASNGDVTSVMTITPGALPKLALAPAAAIELSLTPTAPAGSDPSLSFDLRGVRVAVDVEAVWDAILDRSAVQFFRLVTVKTVPALFNPIAGRELEQVVSVLVEFEGGGTAELTAPDSLQAQVRVDHPIDDVILGRPVSSSYRYTVTAIRANGTQSRDPEPRTGVAAIFFVSLPV